MQLLLQTLHGTRARRNTVDARRTSDSMACQVGIRISRQWPFGSYAPPTDPQKNGRTKQNPLKAGVQDDSVLPCQRCACHDPHKWLQRHGSTLLIPCPQHYLALFTFPPPFRASVRAALPRATVKEDKSLRAMQLPSAFLFLPPFLHGPCTWRRHGAILGATLPVGTAEPTRRLSCRFISMFSSRIRGAGTICSSMQPEIRSYGLSRSDSAISS